MTSSSTTEVIRACTKTREFFEFIPPELDDFINWGSDWQGYAIFICTKYGFSALSREVTRVDTFWDEDFA